MLIYAIWRAKNSLLWEVKLENPTFVSYLANLQLHEFTTVKPAASSPPLQSSSHWLPPPGWVKINVDGSFCDATKTGGYWCDFL